MFQAVQALPKLKMISPRSGNLSSALVSSSLPKEIPCSKLASALRERHRVVVKVVGANRLNAIRISAHIYNSEEDVARLAGALKKELA